MIVPERFSYIEVYLTLRCSFSCPYCINGHTGVSRKRKELSAREWRMALNGIATHGIPITLGGGEPTMHKEFYGIVEGLRPDLRIDLLSNGSFDTDEFVRRIPPERFTQQDPEYKAIRLSFHPRISDQKNLVQQAALLTRQKYPVGIFGLNHPNNLAYNVTMTEACRERGVFFFIRDFLGYYDDRLYGYYKYSSALNGNRKRCQCRIQELLIGPDGNVYRCHRDLYEGAGEIGNVLNMALELTDDFRPCDNCGLCSPCDIKLKLGPDLTTSKCSVEIKLES